MSTDEQVLASLFPSHDLGEASSSSTDPFTFNSNLTAPPFDDDYPKYGEDNDTFDVEEPIRRKRSMTWHARPENAGSPLGIDYRQQALFGGLNADGGNVKVEPYHAATADYHKFIAAQASGIPRRDFGDLSGRQSGSHESIDTTVSNTGSDEANRAPKRNPWGNQSYSELITQAIHSHPSQRATLAQVYDWFIKNIPYFGERASTTSAGGWKNSVRHNLSLHHRFMRVPNEEAGKSSWWMINPETLKAPKRQRRRNTTSTTTGDEPTAVVTARDRIRARLTNGQLKKKEEVDLIARDLKIDTETLPELKLDDNDFRLGRLIRTSFAYINSKRARSNVYDYAAMRASVSPAQQQHNTQYFGAQNENTSGDEFIPNFLANAGVDLSAGSSRSTEQLTEIIDNTTQLRLQQKHSPGYRNAPPVAYRPQHPTPYGRGGFARPPNASSVSPLARALHTNQPVAIRSIESPLWHTGEALTCDVDAVIQHELAAGTTNFDFNMPMDYSS